MGGGLIRSAGGWSQVVSLRRKGTRVASDERILGSGKFVEELLSEAADREKQGLRLRSKMADLGSLAKAVASAEGLEKSELRSGSRRKIAVRARRIMCQLAVRKWGYSGAEVARFLGVTTSAVNRLAASDEAPDLTKYL